MTVLYLQDDVKKALKIHEKKRLDITKFDLIQLDLKNKSIYL